MAADSSIDSTDNAVKQYHIGPYEIYTDKVLGSGMNGHVFLARDIETNKTVAFKQIDYSEEACRELEIHYRLSASEYVVNVDNAFKSECENGMVLNVVTECMQGGNLWRYMHDKKLSERTCAYMAYQICKGVQYIHKHNIAHRDLKPDNILVLDNSPEPKLKICDFGFAKVCAPNQRNLQTLAFTLDYAAPEVLNRRRYDKKCDIWALGVIIYNLLSDGENPFPEYWGAHAGLDPIVRYQALQNEQFLQRLTWLGVSPSAKDLIRKILIINPHLRPTIDQVLEHQWFKSWNNLDKIPKEKKS